MVLGASFGLLGFEWSQSGSGGVLGVALSVSEFCGL